jgi:hypothetical protein
MNTTFPENHTDSYIWVLVFAFTPIYFLVGLLGFYYCVLCIDNYKARSPSINQTPLLQEQNISI